MVSNSVWYSAGVLYPTVSGRLIVVAPACIAAVNTSIKNSVSERVASSAENSTSSVYVRARRTASAACSSASTRVIRSFASRCRSDVARKV